MAEYMDSFPAVVGDTETEIHEGALSRRTFVKAMSFASMGLFGGVRALSTLTSKSPILTDAKGVLLHDVSRCVSCKRCELACSEFKDGAASSYLARVKVARNMGVAGGANYSDASIEGKYGNFRVQADTCKQCPHPVPCAEACPRGAIVADSRTGARKIDARKCIGCGICTTACPWAMPTLNPVTKKATKCDLCDGKPECVHACPTGALKYVSWRNLRLSTPIIQSSIMPAGTTTDCSKCHK